MTKRGKIITGIIIFIFVALLAFNLVIKKMLVKSFFASFKPPAVTISSVKAKSIKWFPRIEAVGNLSAQHGVDINAQVSGNVINIHFRSGQQVRQGDSLITIDDTVEQAQLKFNQAELALKKLNYDRQEKLFKKGAAPISNLDEAKANLQQAQANVDKIEAEIELKHIKAPFSGQLGIRLINLGQYVNPGETSIVTLQSLDPLFLEFFLPEQKLKEIRVGQDLTFSVSEYPGLKFKGTITAINAKADIKTHNVKIQATVPNCPAKALTDPLNHTQFIQAEKEAGSATVIVACNSELNEKNKISKYSFIPGMFTSILVNQPTQGEQIVLPASAISYSLYGDSVYLIKEKSAKDDDKQAEKYVRRVFVRTGDQQGNWVVITQGVKAGDEVVSSGQLKLQNNTPVTINNDIKMPVTKDIDKLGQ